MQNPFSEGVSVQVSGSTENAQSALANLQNSLGATRKSAVALGGVMAGALATAGLGAAVQAASNFEDAMVEVQKVTDEQTADQLAGPIREMAEEIPLAQEAIAGLTADAARFGIEGTANIQNFTRTAAQMGFATDLSAQQAGEALARLATLTNTPTEEINNLGSAIAVLGNNFATSEQEIVQSMLRSSAAMGSLGLQQTEMAGLSAAVNEVSESSERAGTRLRRLSQELMDPARVEGVASALGLSNDEFTRMRNETPLQLIQEMAEAFAENGSEAEALRGELTTVSQQVLGGLSQNLDGLSDALDKSNSGYEEATALQEETDAQTETFSAQVQLLRNQLTNIAIEIGTVLLPPLTSLVGRLGEAAEQFAALNERSNGVAGAVALLGTSIVGFTIAGAAFVSMLGGMTAILGTLGTAFAILTGPIGLAVAAIAALAIAWQQDLGGIQSITREALNSIQTRIQPLVDLLREDVIKTLQVWRDWTNRALSAMSAWWSDHGEEVMNVVRPLITVLEEGIVGALDFLITTARVLLAILRGDFTGAFEIIENFLWRQVDRYKTIGQALMEAIIEGIKGVAPDVGQTVEDIAQDIRDKLPGSDAKEGPLSDLTDSARAIGEVFEAQVGIDASQMVQGRMPQPQIRQAQNGAQAGTERVEIVLDERTDVINSRVERGAENVIVRRERRSDRMRNRGTGI